MRFRPANIRLINRRHYLPRLLLPLSSFKRNDQRTLTGHYISGKGRRRHVQNSGVGVVCLQKLVVEIQRGIHESTLFGSIRSLQADLELESILDAQNDQPSGATVWPNALCEG
jgi:hypothetical protein